MPTPKPTPAIDLPPKAFLDALHAWKGRGVRGPWRQSKEWALFKAGFNAACAAANARTLARYPAPPTRTLALTDRTRDAFKPTHEGRRDMTKQRGMP